MARARAAEMTAMVEENRAKVVEAEASIPWLSRGLPQRQLGVMDYYRLRNIQSDTQMREAISDKPGGTPARSRNR